MYLVHGSTTPTRLSIEAVDVLFTVLVRVRGELDIATTPQLAATLGPLESRHCELDLAWVPFMDTAGLTLLLTHQHRAEAAGGALHVVDVSPSVTRFLDLTQTTSRLLKYPGCT
jgi:anti-sigma B factor antagonist